jgi:hypothetical protein
MPVAVFDKSKQARRRLMMDVLSSWMVIVNLMRGGHSRFDPTKVYRVELIVILLDPLVLSSSE